MPRQVLVIARTCGLCGGRYDLTKGNAKSAVCGPCWDATEPIRQETAAIRADQGSPWVRVINAAG